MSLKLDYKLAVGWTSALHIKTNIHMLLALYQCIVLKFEKLGVFYYW